MGKQWFDMQGFGARVERALGDKDLTKVLSSYRAIVGPMSMEQYLQAAQQARALLKAGQRPTASQLAALEFAIRRMRPAPLVQSGKVAELSAETVTAFPEWSAFTGKVTPFLRSVGRIDRVIPGQSHGGHVGTGFLVSERLLVTNQHVLDELSYGSGLLERGQAVVRFQQEYQTTASEAPVEVLGLIDVHDVEDLALFEIAPVPLSDQRQPLVFEETAPRVGEPVVAIGYPANDPIRNPEFVPLLFGNTFGVKRCAPGELLSQRGTTIHHDCSTLGGNSGSPVLSMRTGRVVGVHKEGVFLYKNGAVDAATAKAFVAPHL